ncbi:MAG: hypothetical protein KF881_01510 [Acidobacteria bacterium]|nr:hypothetical protein [Acidobacteriota bacterium]
MAESALFKQNHNIRLFIGSVCKLKDPKSWDVGSYDHVYFKAFFDIEKVSLLSFYAFLLQEFSAKFLEAGTTINASKAIAESFNKQINLRLSLTSYSKPFCKFDDRISVLEIRIPIDVFKKEVRDHLPELRNRLHDALKEVPENLRATRHLDNKKRRFYSLENVGPHNVYEIFFRQLFNIRRATAVFKDLASTLEKRFAKILSNSSGLKHQEIAVACICLSFLALYFNGSLEYFTGIANVKRRARGAIENRNLGGLLVCYKRTEPLSRMERAIFGIIADKVTSVIAGQILVDEHKIREEVLNGRGYSILKSFWETHLRALTHSYDELNYSDEKISAAFNELYSGPLEQTLSTGTFELISDYLDNLSKATAEDRNSLASNCTAVKESIRIDGQDWGSLFKDIELELLDIPNNRLYVDRAVIVNIIKGAAFNSGQLGSAPKLNYLMYDGKDEKTTEFHKAQRVSINIFDDGEGSNDLVAVAQNDQGTTYGRIHSDWRKAVNGMGSVELHSNGKSVSFTPSLKEVTNSEVIAGFKTIINIYKLSYD